MGKIEEIAEIHHKCVVNEFKETGVTTTINHGHLLEMWLKHDKIIVATHKKNGNVVGFMAIWDNESMIYVDPDYQRQGIGSELLKKINESEVWVMEGNTKAENFYKKNGFKPTDSRETTKLGHDITEIKWVKNADA